MAPNQDVPREEPRPSRRRPEPRRNGFVVGVVPSETEFLFSDCLGTEPNASPSGILRRRRRRREKA